jgi:hypothetical protein
LRPGHLHVGPASDGRHLFDETSVIRLVPDDQGAIVAITGQEKYRRPTLSETLPHRLPVHAGVDPAAASKFFEQLFAFLHADQ